MGPGELLGRRWATADFFTRLIDEVWTILFWRDVFGGLAFAAVVALHERGRLVHAYASLGFMGLLLGVICGCSMITFIGSPYSALILATMPSTMLT